MFVLLCALSTPSLAKRQTTNINIENKLSALEKQNNGRLGIYAINTLNNQRIVYRANERFPLCSTAKVMAVSAILKQSEDKPNFLHKKIFFSKIALITSGYAPITQRHLLTGMTLAELCSAAIKYSDNAAMNLLIKQLGSPNAVTHFARTIGDQTFRLDRLEPQLNSAIPGDQRDTSSPESMATSLQKIILDGALALPQRQLLTSWLIHNTTGDTRIRSSVAKKCLVGDKTGTGDYGTTNDIAILWPAHCKPIVLAIYFTQNKQKATPANIVITAATQLVLQKFAAWKWSPIASRCLRR